MIVHLRIFWRMVQFLFIGLLISHLQHQNGTLPQFINLWLINPGSSDRLQTAGRTYMTRCQIREALRCFYSRTTCAQCFRATRVFGTNYCFTHWHALISWRMRCGCTWITNISTERLVLDQKWPKTDLVERSASVHQCWPDFHRQFLVISSLVVETDGCHLQCQWEI